MSDAKVLVLRPDSASRLDRFTSLLTGLDIEIVNLCAFAGEPVPERVDADGLIILGGRASANDATTTPELAAMIDLISDALTTQVPTLGICLGAQLLARAAGGTVTPGPSGLEIGVADILLLPEAANDELLSEMPEVFRAPTFHLDVVAELPPGATWLATGVMYQHQAYRVGDSAWGLQFHPEARRAMYAHWAHNLGLPDPGIGHRALEGLADYRRVGDAVDEVNWKIGRRFGEIVQARRGKAEKSG